MKGERDNVLVVDDYGHHPTEVQATLAAAASSGRRVVVLFQPHRYTRTAHQMDEFSRAFYSADAVLVTDIYAASEDPIPGVTAEALAALVAAHGHKHVEYVGSLDAAVDRLAALARPGDLVLTLGAGNVFRAGEELLKRLEAERG
jgi:UDP-N-acetylmuramate--alanine ligase